LFQWILRPQRTHEVTSRSHSNRFLANFNKTCLRDMQLFYQRHVLSTVAYLLNFDIFLQKITAVYRSYFACNFFFHKSIKIPIHLKDTRELSGREWVPQADNKNISIYLQIANSSWCRPWNIVSNKCHDICLTEIHSTTSWINSTHVY